MSGSLASSVHGIPWSTQDADLVADLEPDRVEDLVHAPLRLGEDPESAVEVASAEDTVIEKLTWFRLGGGVSERQWLDVLGVLKVQGTKLDRAYLRRWAEDRGVSDLLDRAIEEAGLRG